MGEFINDVMRGDPKSVFLIVAIYFLLAACISLIYCLRLRRWPSVVGQLDKKDISAWLPNAIAGDRQFSVDTAYSYDVDGQRYEGTRVSPFYIMATYNLRIVLKLQMKDITELGQNRVRVYYNPKRPEKSFLILPGLIGYIFILAFGLTPMALYLIF